MKKLLLIQTYGSLRKGLHVTQSKYPPLGLGIVAKLTPQDWQVDIVDSFSESQLNHEADLVAISSYTPTINNAYLVAHHYRKRNIPVIIGGIHATLLPDEVSAYCDSVVIGEAEGIWPKIINDFEKGILQKRYLSTYCSVDQICSPDYNIFNKKYKLNNIQASRGCPMNCDYCSITLLTGKKYRKRPFENVINDWRSIEQDFIWFTDDNLFGFSANDRQWSRELFSKIEAENKSKKWMCFASVNSLLDEKTIAAAAKSGCKLIYIGIETNDEESLISVRKNISQLKLYKKVIDNLHKNGISVLAGIMIGFDTDTPESIEKRTDFILESDFDSYFLTVLTPMPGTEFYNNLFKEGRIRYCNFPSDWDHYDWTELVYIPSRMTIDCAEKAIHKAYQKCYSFQAIKNKYRQTRKNLSSADNAVLNYVSNMDFRETFLKRN